MIHYHNTEFTLILVTCFCFNAHTALVLHLDTKTKQLLLITKLHHITPQVESIEKPQKCTCMSNALPFFFQA